MLSRRHDPALEPLLAGCSERLAARFGLHFPRERWVDLERALASVAGELGCGDVRSCLEWLLTAPLTASQGDILARHLTVGETYFFRDAAAFTALREHILPALVEARRYGDAGARRLRLWSAGCSTGEEAYSIAIAVADALPDLPRWNVTIVGTDLNPHALATARAGIYPEWSFRDGSSLKARCFARGADGRYGLDRRYRAMVNFAPLNLAEDRYPGVDTNTNAMDVIFCRNVLMYFHPERARAVVDRLARSLVDGGWLVVSAVESALVVCPDLQAQRLPGLILFRKGAPPPDRPPAAAHTAGRPSQRAARNAEAARAASAAPASAAEAVLAAASDLYAEGRYGEVVAILERLLANEPDRADAMLLLARAQANRGSLVEALAWCDKAVAADRLDPAASYLRASILLELGQAEAAVAAFKRTLYLDPDRPLAHFALGNLLASQGRGGDALRHYRHARSLLGALPREQLLPEAEGIPAGRLREMVEAILGMETAR